MGRYVDIMSDLCLPSALILCLPSASDFFFTASGFRIKQGIPVREGREGEGLVVGRRPSLRGRNAPRTGIFFETYILYVGAFVKSL